MNPVEREQIPTLLRPLLGLPNAPTPDRVLFATWHEVFQAEGVPAELARDAILEVLRTAEFFPSPAVVLRAARKLREEAYRARERAELNRRIHEAAQRRTLAPGPAEKRRPLPPGYPPRDGPPRDPKNARWTPKASPVLGADGQPDPFWPELPDREPAWRRKMRYDHGIDSWEQASALTVEAARAARKPSESRVHGVRSLI